MLRFNVSDLGRRFDRDPKRSVVAPNLCQDLGAHSGIFKAYDLRGQQASVSVNSPFVHLFYLSSSCFKESSLTNRARVSNLPN